MTGSRILSDVTRGILVCVVCLLSVRGLAAAQSGEVPPIAQAEETDPKRLYTAGKLAYAAGEFNEAIAFFERAYALSDAPGLLFNLAQAHRLAGESHCAQARALYRSYLSAVPAADNRREVEERIAELAACADNLERSTTTPTSPKEPITPAVPPALEPVAPPPRARRASLGPILLTVAGAVTTIAGGLLYARVAAEYRDAERRCPCYPGTFTRWERLTYVGYAGLGVGSAALLAGASWWVSGGLTNRGTTALITVRSHF